MSMCGGCVVKASRGVIAIPSPSFLALLLTGFITSSTTLRKVSTTSTHLPWETWSVRPVEILPMLVPQIYTSSISRLESVARVTEQSGELTEGDATAVREGTTGEFGRPVMCEGSSLKIPSEVLIFSCWVTLATARLQAQFVTRRVTPSRFFIGRTA